MIVYLEDKIINYIKAKIKKFNLLAIETAHKLLYKIHPLVRICITE